MLRWRLLDSGIVESVVEAALLDLSISINIMELLTCVFAIELGFKSGLFKAVMKIVYLNDNTAAVNDWKKQRSVGVVQDVAMRRRKDIFVQHIPGNRNSIADCFSRQKLKEAKRL